MGFEEVSSGEMLGVRVTACKHKRSKSFPVRTGIEDLEASNRLKLIIQLEKILQNQVAVRCALEKALGYGFSSHKIAAETLMPKHATELIREIAMLEFEVGHLEQYLLSLKRQAFDQQLTSVSPPSKDDTLKSLVWTFEFF